MASWVGCSQASYDMISMRSANASVRQFSVRVFRATTIDKPRGLYWIPHSQDPKPFTNAIRRIANYTIPDSRLSYGCMRQIRGKYVSEAVFQAILYKVALQTLLLAVAPETPSINVTPP